MHEDRDCDADREIGVGRQAIAFLKERFGVAPLYARVDVVDDERGDPVVLEFEAIEPNLFLAFSAGAADRLAAAILAG